MVITKKSLTTEECEETLKLIRRFPYKMTPEEIAIFGAVGLMALGFFGGLFYYYLSKR